MKQLLFTLVFFSFLQAKYLPEVTLSFSQKEQSQLLHLFHIHHAQKHHSNDYMIHKGWNLFETPQNGIDVIQTFQNINNIKFVLTYDKVSKLWAGFTMKQSILKDIREMLLLRYLEPNVMFFVLSDRDMMIAVKSTTVNPRCQKIMDNKNYSYIKDSGLDDIPSYAKDNSIAVMPRYHSHFNRGFYDDTRIILIYPKIKVGKSAQKKYGPADPFILIKYAKAYENKTFYIYDYLQKQCTKGVFPSRKMPPVPLLEVLDK